MIERTNFITNEDLEQITYVDAGIPYCMRLLSSHISEEHWFWPKIALAALILATSVKELFLCV